MRISFLAVVILGLTQIAQGDPTDRLFICKLTTAPDMKVTRIVKQFDDYSESGNEIRFDWGTYKVVANAKYNYAFTFHACQKAPFREIISGQVYADDELVNRIGAGFGVDLRDSDGKELAWLRCRIAKWEENAPSRQ